LHLTYHLAYGLNGTDQTNPIQNIIGPGDFAYEDDNSFQTNPALKFPNDQTFTSWVNAHGVTRENAYQHTDPTNLVPATRVSYPDPYWLMDISANGIWVEYLKDQLLKWMAFPTKNSTGMFFDDGFPPWFRYTPTNWWTTVAGG